jgi:D-glycero-D-manno-heptose 1,7-bisphosphate phosphatase
VKLILLDRDGVLNDETGGYIKSPADIRMIPGSARALARLNRAGFKVAVCTNQGVVGRGYIGADMLGRINEHLARQLAAEGGRWDAMFICSDHPDRPTRRRKPGPGMLEEALQMFQADPAATPMIGDNLRDLEAAAALGCPRHLVRTGHGAKAQAEGIPDRVLPVRVHDDLAAAVTALLGPE